MLTFATPASAVLPLPLPLPLPLLHPPLNENEEENENENEDENENEGGDGAETAGGRWDELGTDVRRLRSAQVSVGEWGRE